MKQQIYRFFITLSVLGVFLTVGQSFARKKPVKPANARRQLKGYIKVPDTIEDAPQLQIYFSGRMVKSNKDGFFTLPLDADDFQKGRLKDLSLLICKRFEPEHDKNNTIKDFVITKTNKYKYYELERELEECTNRWYWEIHEKSLEDKKFVIPENCVVVSLSPKYVDSVQDWSLRLAKQFIGLPKIVLNSKITERDKFKRVEVKTALEAIQESPYYQTVTEKRCEKCGVLTNMPV